MNSENLQESVELKCRNCGFDKFEILDKSFVNFATAKDDTNFKCDKCGRIVTKKQLIKENEKEISSSVEKIASDSVKQTETELKKMLKGL